MWRFHPMFWLIALFVYLFWSRRRRWARRWAMASPMDYPPNSPRGWGLRHAMRDGGWEGPRPAPTPQPLAQPDATLVESLESRIAGLEQRLDFAERLLSGRESAPPKS